MSRQTRVYIGKVSDRTTERDVERFLKGFGKVREIVNKGTYMFVEFDDHRDASDAIAELSGRELNGERVHVQWANRRDRSPRGPSRAVRGEGRGSGRFPPPRNTNWRVLIRNLSMRATWADIKDFMRQEAEVTYAEAHRRRRGEGIADFASKQDMKRAVERLDGRDLKGERVELVEDDSVRRSSSTASSRGRSRSRSRSRQRDDRDRERRSRSTRSRSRDRPRNAANDRDALGPRSREDRDTRARASRSRSRSPQNRGGRANTGADRDRDEAPRSEREGRLTSERSERNGDRDRDRL